MKKTVQNILAELAKRILAKYKPKIIGITGSVGKTSTKEAVFFVVNQKYRAYRPLKNFNNEFGLPFAIFGTDSPGRSIFAWLSLLAKAFGLILFKQKYPEVLVLEYGVDKPGDMDHLLSIAHPNISIITSIGISHYEFFKSEEAIEHEKGRLAEVLASTEQLIVNADDPKSFNQQRKTKAKVLSYALSNTADVQLVKKSENVTGQYSTDVAFKTPTRTIEASVRALGNPHLEAVATAVAVGEALGIETDLIARGIQDYKPAPGRLNILDGIKHSVIIDDSYNAAPTSMREALALFDRLPSAHKIAVLGDMRELGALSEKAHEDMGKFVASLNMDKLHTVGDGGKLIAKAVLASGFPESKLSIWNNSDEAKKVILNSIEPNSLILVKGSQFVRLEKITKELLTDPMRAPELLCRQSGKWLEI